MALVKRARVQVVDTAPVNLCHFASGVLDHNFKDVRVSTRSGPKSLKFEAAQFTASATPREDEHLRYMVGVYDQEQNTLTLHPAMTHDMKLTIKGDKGAAALPLAAPPPAALSVGQAIIAARKDLIGTFGGAKKKAEIAAAERNQVKAELVQVMATKMGENMNQAAAMEADIEQEADEFRPIPPFDRDAATPDTIYKFDDLVTPLEQAAMRAVVKPLLKCNSDNIFSWRSMKTYPDFVLDILEGLIALNIPSKSRLQRVIALQYVAWLSWFRMASRRARFTADTMAEDQPNMPEDVRQRMLELFAERSGEGAGYVLSGRNRDMIVSYMLVLSMHAHGFQPLPIGPIASSLGVTVPKLSLHFRSLGCSLSGEEQAKLASLVVPLKFPHVRRGRTAK
eukprot:m.240303 g.240303  ORF g.240303 m.240303 type:complete len:395 (+) comp23291_c0_seq1:2-1186(+)